MTTLPIPVIDLVENRPCTTSLAIAEYFEKPHKDVLESIRKLIADCPSDFTERNFSPSEYTDPTGRKLPMYQVFFDGFILLVMGYTGPKVLKMKLAYIEAFNAMKAKLEKQKLINPSNTLTSAQQNILQNIVDAKVKLASDLDNPGRLGLYVRIWQRFKKHFQLAKYSQLEQDKFPEAITYLVQMDVNARKIEHVQDCGQSQTLEAKPIAGEETNLDPEAYKTGKKVFDLLASARYDLELAADHMLFLYSGRSAYLEADKRVLFDNLTDCVKAASSGIQSAVLNIRSACRIKSRIEFIKGHK